MSKLLPFWFFSCFWRKRRGRVVGRTPWQFQFLSMRCREWEWVEEVLFSLFKMIWWKHKRTRESVLYILCEPIWWKGRVPLSTERKVERTREKERETLKVTEDSTEYNRIKNHLQDKSHIRSSPIFDLIFNLFLIWLKVWSNWIISRCRSLAPGEEEVVSQKKVLGFWEYSFLNWMALIIFKQASSQSSHRGAAPALVYPSVPNEEPLVSQTSVK